MGLLFSKKEFWGSLIALLWAQVRIRVPEKYIRRGSFQEWEEGYIKAEERVKTNLMSSQLGLGGGSVSKPTRHPIQDGAQGQRVVALNSGRRLESAGE